MSEHPEPGKDDHSGPLGQERMDPDEVEPARKASDRLMSIPGAKWVVAAIASFRDGGSLGGGAGRREG
jgi:hypothetical protein